MYVGTTTYLRYHVHVINQVICSALSVSPLLVQL